MSKEVLPKKMAVAEHSPESSASTSMQPCRVVGIGASAGGQEALEQFFTAMPTDCGLTFVVIMHLPAEGPAYFAEMLGRYTPMTVVTAEEGMAPRPDTIHVIPAGRELTLDNGAFRLEAPVEKPGVFHPIDRFFRSLAVDAGKRCVAVILSGFGTDGAKGIKAVKAAGGTVIVQEPDSALHPAMPRSAIATGAADLVVPAAQLAETISGLARETCPLPAQACHATDLDDDLAAIFAIIRSRTGHDFSAYKRNTVIRRIERRMAVNEVAGMKKYLVLLEANEQEAEALGQEILIGVTSFFRDPEAFEVLRREILPRLFANRDPDDPVRIWHACCATGEEVYSSAILIREYLAEQRLDTRVQIFATDIDETAIAQARAGLYDNDIEAEVSQERLTTFFSRLDGRWQVAKQLREMVIFAHHSLIKDPPFSRVDLLICRNFLIYLNPDMQKRLIALFHMALKPHGVLFLGAAETVGRSSDLFTPCDKKWKIFERLEGSRREHVTFPFATPVRRQPRPGALPRLAEAEEKQPGLLAEKLLVERYAPPCLVVNEKYEVIHVSTRAQRLIEVPVGGPTRDILKMAREELRPALRAAIYKAFTEQRQVAFRGVKVMADGEEAVVNVLVEPLAAPLPAEKLAVVILEPGSLPSPLPPRAGGDDSHGDDGASKDRLILQLEEQLRVTHEQLQAVTEQLESSQEGFLSANEELMSINEEFQSANEELQSTNEELETSKEELQALNEELSTVNAELQGKVEELDLANSDLENLFRSAEVATIFLDRQLSIRRFSPAMAEIFNLIPADIGRPFRHLTGTIDWTGLPEDARAVLTTLVPVEREVAVIEGARHFLMRVLPYRNTEGRIDGIAVTLIDITGLRRAEERIRSTALFPEENPSPVLRITADGTLNFANRSAADLLAQWQCAVGGAVPDFVRQELAAALASGAPRELEFRCAERDLSFMLVPIAGRGYVNFYGRDITERKQAEQALAESEQRVRRKLDSIISPEGDVGSLDLADIIDAPALQALVNDFYELTKMPMGLIDLNGKVLVGVGWQDICTKFHRVNPETCRNCIESDVQLSAGVPHGAYKVYRCKNNMWDVATPIQVGDRHFGNLFMGQFFFEDEPLDYELFRAQARTYEFDEQAYIAALEAVPRLSRDTLHTSMNFFMKLAELLSKLSYSNIKLARSLEERETLMVSLRESEARFRGMFERHNAVMLLIEPESGAIVDANSAAVEFYGYSREALRDLNIQDFNQLPPAEVAAERRKVVEVHRNHFLFPHRVATGETRWVEVYSTPIAVQGKLLLFSIIHDITERKQAEELIQWQVEALRTKETDLNEAQRLAHIGNWHWDARTDVTTGSDELLRIFGFDPATQTMPDFKEQRGRCYPVEDWERINAAVQRALETGVGYELDVRALRNGTTVWVITRSEVIRDAENRMIGLRGTVQDITARKQAETRQDLLAETAHQLLASDSPQEVVDSLCQKVMTFLDCQTFFNFLVDEQQGRLRLNACTGIPEEEKAKLEWLDYGVAVCGCAARDACRIVAEDILNSSDPRTELVKSYGIRAYACHPLMAQGRVLGTLSFGSRSKDCFSSDDLALMKAVADHVAIAMERKQAEVTLNESESFYRQTLESLPGMVFTTRPDGYCDFQSQQWVDFTGVPMVEHLGDGWNKLLHPEDRPRAFAAWSNAVAEVAPYDLEYRVRRHDGKYEWFKVRGRPIRNEAGEIVRWFGTAVNIDDLVRTQEELQRAKVAAEAATRAKSEFLANMSHEIRTPMTVFMSGLEHLLQIEDNSEHRELLEMADDSAKRLRTLIDDILDFSRIEARRVELEEGPFDLRCCVHEAVEMFALPVREKQLRLETAVAAEIPSIVVGDRDRLGQVLTNLVGNAVKFTPAGEVRVTVQLRAGFLEFSIADTGIGIPEEKHRLLFQRFTQVDPSFHRQYGGSGLGLSICRGLVELMGGRIAVRNREGGGCVFTFTVPLKAAASQDLAPSAPLPEVSGENRPAARILLADDEPMIRQVITMMLTRRGWHAETAVSGREAVEKWERGDFDILLMDLQMPEMNGLEAARAIRSREAAEKKRVHIIALTAHARKEIVEECLQEGMDKVLIKPVQMNDLYAAIENCLSG